jgi:hypothetical protein
MTVYDPAIYRTVVAENGGVDRKFHSVNKLLIDMAAAGMIGLHVGDDPPGDTTVVWLDLTLPENGNGQAKVYQTGNWITLTPEYFFVHYGVSTAAAAASALAAANSASAAEGFKDQTAADALSTAADVVSADAAKDAAEAAQAAAEAALAATEIAADNFDDVYLGAKASDPTLDNDGNALVEGQLYWNTSSNSLKVYDGAAWQAYSAAAGITSLVEDSSPQLGGNLDLNGHVITGLEIGTNVQAQSSNLDSWSMVVPSDYLTTTAAAAAYQPVNSTLTSLAGASANGVSLVTAADYAAMRALLDLEAGTDFLSPSAIAAAYQAISARLTDIAGLAVTDGNIIVGNGTTWVAESGATARTSLGLGTGDSPQFTGVNVGHGSDTPLSRSAAGVIAVAGIPLYPQIPQVSLSTATTLDATHANCHLLHPSSDNNARTFTIDSNTNLALPLGTVFVFVNKINTLSIAITSDTLTWAPTGGTGTRQLAANGIATAMKIGSTEWIISGVGLS